MLLTHEKESRKGSQREMQPTSRVINEHKCSATTAKNTRIQMFKSSVWLEGPLP